VILFLAAVLILGAPGFARINPLNKPAWPRHKERSTQSIGKKQRI